MFTAKIEGTYKSKVYIDLFFFKIVRGWRTDHFTFAQSVGTPEFHTSWVPVKNIPVALSLDVSQTGIDFGLQVLSQDFPIQHVTFPSGGSASIHWTPIKGVQIEKDRKLKDREQHFEGVQKQRERFGEEIARIKAKIAEKEVLLKG